MDGESEMITALLLPPPFFFSSSFLLRQSSFHAARQPEIGWTAFWGKWRTCPGLTDRGQGRPAGAQREESQRLSGRRRSMDGPNMTCRPRRGGKPAAERHETLRYGGLYVLHLSGSLQT